MRPIFVWPNGWTRNEASYKRVVASRSRIEPTHNWVECGQLVFTLWYWWPGRCKFSYLVRSVSNKAWISTKRGWPGPFGSWQKLWFWLWFLDWVAASWNHNRLSMNAWHLPVLRIGCQLQHYMWTKKKSCVKFVFVYTFVSLWTFFCIYKKEVVLKMYVPVLQIKLQYIKYRITSNLFYKSHSHELVLLWIDGGFCCNR